MNINFKLGSATMMNAAMTTASVNNRINNEFIKSNWYERISKLNGHLSDELTQEWMDVFNRCTIGYTLIKYKVALNTCQYQKKGQVLSHVEMTVMNWIVKDGRPTVVCKVKDFVRNTETIEESEYNHFDLGNDGFTAKTKSRARFYIEPCYAGFTCSKEAFDTYMAKTQQVINETKGL